jgi:DNA repair protein RadD
MIQLRQYQEEAVQSVFDYYASGNQGNPVIAMPTGTGKSVVIAEFCRRVLQHWPTHRIVVATHVKELVEQNAKKMLEIWPTAPVGIYSAGLGSRDTMQSIIFGGVASIIGAQERFGLRHLMLVDEAHLVSPIVDSTYQKVIKGFKLLNPNFKTIGLTATDYRTGQGDIAGEGNLFTDVCCDQTSLNKFNWFISEGYLLPLVPKRTMTELDVSNVSITNGDYSQNELQKAVDQYGITYQCCREIMEYASQRRSWLIFASGVEHSEHVAQCLQTLGIQAAAVHAKLTKAERDERITSFKNGTLRCIVNNNVLTTGFDYPGLDFIGILRPTTSTGLWVQMLGRGTRPLYFPGYDLSTKEARLAAIAHSRKQNCLVLDFAGNTRRLGPINDPVRPKKRVKGSTPGVAPIKICPKCGVYNHASATRCENPACDAVFERAAKLLHEASRAELIRADEPVYQTLPVQRVLYTKQNLKGRPPALKVSYFCGMDHVTEMQFFENKGSFARTSARRWWRERNAGEPPDTVDLALQMQEFLREPKAIKVQYNLKNPKIEEYIW